MRISSCIISVYTMKKIQKIKIAQKWMRFHSILTGIVFGVYFLSAFLYSPDFFFSDVLSKFHAIADTITVTGKVLSPPVKPVVTLTNTCTQGVLGTTVDWVDDENSYTYDIFRDGNLLVANRINTLYQDNNIAIGSEHEYVVEAYGPMGDGFAVSDPVSVIALSVCAVILPSPAVTATSLDNVDISGQFGTIHTVRQSFLISGTTNMPGSLVNVTISGGSSTVSLQTTANINGYWEVLVPAPLDYGMHTTTITAIDSSDGARVATQILSVEVDQIAEVPVNTPPIAEVPINTVSIANNNHNRQVKKPTHHQIIPMQTRVPVFKRDIPQSTHALIPVNFIIRNTSASQAVLQGDSFNIDLEITTIDTQYLSKPARIRYSILDDAFKSIAIVTKDITLTEEGSHIYENIKIPTDLGKGDYTMQVELLVDTFDIVRTTPFSVVELPLFTLGSGAIITYPQFVRNIGWFVFGLLFSLLWWLFLWIHEYWLYLHATRFITEDHLLKKGFIQKRRGVSS